MKLMKRSRDTLTSVAPSSMAMQVTLRLAPVKATGIKSFASQVPQSCQSNVHTTWVKHACIALENIQTLGDICND